MKHLQTISGFAIQTNKDEDIYLTSLGVDEESGGLEILETTRYILSKDLITYDDLEVAKEVVEAIKDDAFSYEPKVISISVDVIIGEV